MRRRILLVDDEPHVTTGIKRVLSQDPYDVVCVESAKEAFAVMAKESVDVVISDERMPGLSGSEFLSAVYKKYPETVRIILTGEATLEAAVRAINDGQIYRFLIKPCNDLDLRMTVKRALQQRDLMIQAARLLAASRHQSELIREAQIANPELFEIKRDREGTIIVENPWVGLKGDLDNLIQEIIEQTDEIS